MPAKLTPDVLSYLSVVIWIQACAPRDVSVWHSFPRENYLSTVYWQPRWGGVMSGGSQAYSRFKVSKFELSHIFIWGLPSSKIINQKNMHSLNTYSNPKEVIHYDKKAINRKCNQIKTYCVKEINLSSKSSTIVSVVMDNSCLVREMFQVLP